MCACTHAPYVAICEGREATGRVRRVGEGRGREVTRGAARTRTWDAQRLTLDIIRADTAADLSVGGTTRAGAVMITLGWTRATVWTPECRPARVSSCEPRARSSPGAKDFF